MIFAIRVSVCYVHTCRNVSFFVLAHMTALSVWTIGLCHIQLIMQRINKASDRQVVCVLTSHTHTHKQKHVQVHRRARASKERRLSTVYVYVYKLQNCCVFPKMLLIIPYVVYSSVNEWLSHTSLPRLLLLFTDKYLVIENVNTLRCVEKVS